MNRKFTEDYLVICVSGFFGGVVLASTWADLSLYRLGFTALIPIIVMIRVVAIRAVGLCFCAGIAWMWIFGHFGVPTRIPESCFNTNVAAQARVADFPEVYAGFNDLRLQRVELELASLDRDECQLIQRARVFYDGEIPLRLGQVLTLEMVLKRESGLANFAPDASAANSAVDRRFVRGSVTRLVSVVDAPTRFEFWRERLSSAVQQHPRLSDATKGLIGALLVADKRYLPESLARVTRELGIGHLLVVSGLHISLVGAGSLWLARLVVYPLSWWLWPQAIRVMAGLIGLLAASSYAGLAGFSLPTQRALLAFSIWWIVHILGRGSYRFRVFALVLLTLVVVNPLIVLSVSFWMSFTAVFGVLWVLQASLTGPQDTSLLRTQTLICVLLAPLMTHTFLGFSPASIPANIVAIPVATFCWVPLTLLGGLFSILGFGELSDLCWRLVGFTVDLIMNHGVPLLPNELLMPMALPWYSAAILTLTVMLCLLPVGSFRRSGMLASGGLLFALTLLTLPKSGAKLTVFDVGQGSSALFEADGRRLLFDLGGGIPEVFYRFDNSVYPYLLKHRIDHVDTVAVSHDDFDHSGGADSSRFYLTWDQWISPDPMRPGSQPCRTGRVERWSEQVQLSWLSGLPASSMSSDNDRSCVIKIEAYGRSILITGDIGKQHERELVRYWREELRADFLVVGHHGSNTSTGATFLKWVQPDYAIISAGFQNPFNHPSVEVLARLEAVNSQILNTADTGALQFEWEDTTALRTLISRRDWARFWQRNYSD
jgi:competence protein ComEC